MTDIQQWRRMMQPKRVRTPVPRIEADVKDSLTEAASSSSATPKRKLRPKISSYFTHHGPTKSSMKLETVFTDIGDYDDQHSGTFAETVASQSYQPEAEQVMDSIMAKLLTYPNRGLGPQHTGSILTILEAYRNILDENRTLAYNCQVATLCRHAMEVNADKSIRGWEAGRANLRSEIQRLELVINGKKGFAGDIEARQNNVVDRRSKLSKKRNNRENVFEFLASSRTEDEDARRSQRALPRHRPRSPSHQDSALSHTISTTSIHHDLPFGSPPSPSLANNLLEPSFFDHLSNDSDTDSFPSYTEPPRKHSFPQSDATFSSFESSMNITSSDAVEDTAALRISRADTSEVRQIAELVAKQRGVDPDLLMEEVALLCHGDLRMQQSSQPLSSSPPEDAIARDLEVAAAPIVSGSPSSIAGGGGRRRFSFDAGDDSGFGSLQSLRGRSAAYLPLGRSQTALEPRVGSHTSSISSHPPLNVLPISPENANALLSPKSIPSPTHSGSLAQPTREGSSSSIVTALKDMNNSEASSRSESRSSSYSGHGNPLLLARFSSSPKEMSQPSSTSSGMPNAGRRLVEEKNSLRANSLATAAARAAGKRCSSGSNGGGQSPSQPRSQRSSVQSSTSSLFRRSHIDSDDVKVVNMANAVADHADQA